MTASQSGSAGALRGVRVLDFGGEISNYCGRLFAQLGADVILVEPTGGARYRQAHPKSEVNETSLRFHYDNVDKRSMSVNLMTPRGREVFSRLAKSADLLLDDRTEHDLRARGFDHRDLPAMFPQLVTTVVTPFGLSGPYADFHATDATCMAFGGMLWLGGYDEGPPVQPAGHQAYRAGSLFAAVASMAALVGVHENSSELIDVSVQECVSLGLENAIQYVDLEGYERRRHGGKQKQAGFGVFPSADGFVFLIAGGIGGNRFWNNFVDWMKAEGVVGAEVLEQERWWERAFVESAEGKDLFWQIFTPYSKQQTKQNLLDAAIRWNVPLSPVKTMAEVHGSEQLRAREFFVSTLVDSVAADAPGAPYRLAKTPWASSGRGPKLGGGTDDVLRDLGFTTEEVATMRQAGDIS